MAALAKQGREDVITRQDTQKIAYTRNSSEYNFEMRFKKKKKKKCEDFAICAIKPSEPVMPKRKSRLQLGSHPFLQRTPTRTGKCCWSANGSPVPVTPCHQAGIFLFHVTDAAKPTHYVKLYCCGICGVQE